MEEIGVIVEELFFLADEAERVSQNLASIGKYKEASRFSDIAKECKEYALFLMGRYGYTRE